MSLILKQFLIIVLNLVIGFVVGMVIMLVLDHLWANGQLREIILAMGNHTFHGSTP